MAKNTGWYPITMVGKVLIVLYSLVPPWVAYAETTQTMPTLLRPPLLGGMVAVLAIALLCKWTNQKLFHAKRR